MGSGVLLAALVVLWFVVLVPMVVTRGDAQGGRAELADSGRTLQRRRTVDPVVHADTERVSIDRDLLRTSGELQVDVHALRRRTLGGLVAAGRAGPGRRAGLQPVAVDRAGAARPRRRRLRAGAAQGGRAASGWPPAGLPVPPPARRCAPRARPAPRERRQDGRTRPSRRRPVPQLPHPSVPLAPVHPLRARRVVAARTPAPGRLAAERRGRSGRRRHRVRRHRRVPAAPGRQPLKAAPRSGGRATRWWRRGAGTVIFPPRRGCGAVR